MVHVGYIGTETNIPSEVAAEFSRHFYLHVLKGYPLLLEQHLKQLQVTDDGV